ncbi:MAG: hypothetical protein NZ761_10930 [Dehalococcoidia bacterium]|nr:hypothetical protein [Dehalococcoidia bacterium]
MDAELVSVPMAVLVVGLVEVAKRAGLPSRYAALVAVLCGVILALLATLAEEAAGARPWVTGIVEGVTVGLVASGLYSGFKALTERRE